MADAFADPTCHVLLVDDDEGVLRTYGRALRRGGFDVVTADDVSAAVTALRDRDVDVDIVVTDMCLPGGSGLDVLEACRTDRPELPVLFVTGSTEVDLAVRALERGALRYLMKPVEGSALCRAVESARRVAAAMSAGHGGDLGGLAGRDLANLDVRFDAVLTGLSLAFQPVVSWSQRKVVAYEALVRTREATLRRADRFVATADRLGRLRDLGRAVRREAAAFAQRVDDVDVHVNVHPMELSDPELYDVGAPLSRLASRVVLELTERAAVDRMGDVRHRIASLRELGYRIALDDLGAGYASLSNLALLHPDQVKLDMSLVRGIAGDAIRQVLVAAVRNLCGHMGMTLVCEGVEDGPDFAALLAAGCDVVQGYLFGRPAAEIGTIEFERIAGQLPSQLAGRGNGRAPAADGRTQRWTGVGDIACRLARDTQAHLGRIVDAAGRLRDEPKAGERGALVHEIAAGATHVDDALDALVELIERGAARGAL